MPDWTKSMQQSFEYYVVNPTTWKDDRKLDYVKSCKISWDSEADTLGSATIDTTESIGECYVRIYLITIQNGVTEKHPLGTFLVQTPLTNFDGRVKEISMDAYTPLIELKENPPPIGYYAKAGEKVMSIVHKLVSEHTRAPAVLATCETTIHEQNEFVADIDDNWLTYLKDLMTVAKYEFALDEMGRVLFRPIQEADALQPVWTYNDNNSSILHPEISTKHDLYGIPNVVELIYSEPELKDGGDYHIIIKNEDPNSPTSIINRGREITHRITDPPFSGLSVTREQAAEYAKQVLKDLSTVEYELSYTHGYCPARVGDCVRLNYSRAGLENVKAKVISQSIKCEPGCPVTEKAIFTTKLWR